jgi:hypothetical protein
MALARHVAESSSMALSLRGTCGEELVGNQQALLGACHDCLRHTSMVRSQEPNKLLSRPLVGSKQAPVKSEHATLPQRLLRAFAPSLFLPSVTSLAQASRTYHWAPGLLPQCLLLSCVIWRKAC